MATLCMDIGGKYQIILVILYSFLRYSSAEIDNVKNIQPHEIHVGVILDMGSTEGKIIKSCISFAVSDFYDLHNNYSTRLVLHARDSRGEPLQVISAGTPFYSLHTHVYIYI